jgi:hypothetical protein
MTRRERPLLRPFPLVVMSIATFLVIFALLMAREHAGSGSLVPRAIAARSATGNSPPLRTTASGRVLGAATPAAPGSSPVPARSPAGSGAPLTRTSGAARRGAEVDD